MTTEEKSTHTLTPDKIEKTTGVLAVERPLRIDLNGVPATVTMRTPGDDARLARGLLFSEGIVPCPTSGMHIGVPTPHPEGGGDVLEVTVDPDHIARPDFAQLRSLRSHSGCGVCGKRNLSDFKTRRAPHTGKEERRLDPNLLPEWMERMEAQQTIFRQTGGVHAAAIFRSDGALAVVHEDVGRHNAVDKALGALLEKGGLEEAHCMIVSGRLSFEIVDKAGRAAIPHLVGVGAPSTLAVETANAYHITLVGFCRQRRATLYAHPQQVLGIET